MINTAEQHQISGLGFITTPDAFIPWRGVKVSGIVLFLKLMTLRKKELYVLASARKLGEEDRVTKLGRLLLEEEGERYVVTEGSWDKDGTEESGKVEFPKRIYKLAREYGYPEGDCVSKIEEEMPYTPIKRP